MPAYYFGENFHSKKLVDTENQLCEYLFSFLMENSTLKVFDSVDVEITPDFYFQSRKEKYQYVYNRNHKSEYY